MLPRYVVIVCRRCGAPVGGRSNQQTVKCTRCGNVNPLDKAKVLKRTDSSLEAQAAIQAVKIDRKRFPQKDKWRLRYERGR